MTSSAELHQDDDLLPSTPALDEESPFATMMSLFDEAAARLGVKPDEYAILRKPDRELTVAVPNVPLVAVNVSGPVYSALEPVGVDPSVVYRILSPLLPALRLTVTLVVNVYGAAGVATGTCGCPGAAFAAGASGSGIVAMARTMSPSSPAATSLGVSTEAVSHSPSSSLRTWYC